ncbi:hypothetical protein JYT13_00380 [Mariprofundus ferrooxydans]|nr:hypothetical protein [Mariprofundus ferrooxydans]
MNIHEYRAKEILKSFGVSVPCGQLTEDVNKVADIAKALGVV